MVSFTRYAIISVYNFLAGSVLYINYDFDGLLADLECIKLFISESMTLDGISIRIQS